MALTRRALFLLAAAAALGAATAPLARAQGGGDAARWNALVQRPPCDWLEPATVTPLVGREQRAQPRTTRAEIGCVWRTPNGNPVLSVAAVSWPTAANLVGERDELLRQIAQFGGDRFQRLPAPGGTVTIVMRNDRGRVTIFPNGAGSTTAITVNAHFVRQQSPAQEAERRQRAIDYTAALVARYGL